MNASAKFQISNLTKGKLPSLPFRQIKESIIGKKYELSLVFTSNDLAKKLNEIYRDKSKPANVLSFALDKQTGEIFINLKKAKTTEKVAHLLIHALLHLKGWRHSSKMESAEQKFLRQYVSSDLSRPGRRH